MGRPKTIEWREQSYDLGEDTVVTIRFRKDARPKMFHNDTQVIVGEVVGATLQYAAAQPFGAPREQSYSNTDNRGLGATLGSGDPVKALAEGVVSPAPLAVESLDFLSRVENSVVAHELASVEDADTAADEVEIQQ